MPAQFYEHGWSPTGGNYYCNTGTATSTNYLPMTWNQSTTTVISPQQYWPNYNSPNYFTPTTCAQTTYVDNIWQQWNNVVQPTYLRTGELEAQRAEYAAQEKERVAARARARILLGEFLSSEQKTELEHHGRFHVTGSRGRRYCIRAEGQAGNVDLLKPDGGIQARLCCHPREHLPDGDAWLMQMIELQHDEDHFLQTANVHRGALPVAA